MTTARTIWAGEEAFEVALRGRAWETCAALDAVDATIEMEARSLQRPQRTILGLIHGNLSRPLPGAPYTVVLRADQASEVLVEALSEWTKEEADGPPDLHRPKRLRVEDARWRMRDCLVPPTRAPIYAGRAESVLEAKLMLGSRPWMQDWPLEVCDPDRVEEFCAFYDQESDHLVRFDTMQLALYSYDDRRPGDAVLSSWFERTLRRDFALHGNTVASWAALELEADDPELAASDPEIVFRISGMLRRIWEQSLVPIHIDWCP